MDSGGCTGQSETPNDSSTIPLQKLEEGIFPVEANENTPQPPEAILGPITPDADREHGDFPIDILTPLTVVRKLLKPASTTDSSCNCNGNGNGNGNGSELAFVDNNSPRTPKDGVFDPFAPGTENMAKAPQCKKHLHMFSSSVARRLDFDPSSDVVEHDDTVYLSDQEIFESVYKNLLEAIVLTQTEGFLAELANVEFNSENCKTPPSTVLLSGIADTCPPAPMKSGGKPRVIPVGLCRKLDF